MNSEQKKQAFVSQIKSAISQKCTELTAAKKSITYNEGKGIVASVNGVFDSCLGFVPKQISTACDLALVFIAPSMKEKMELLKTIVGTVAGLGGLAAIVAGIGMAVGWGVGTIAAITAWFTGTSIAGPVGWIFAGITLATIAGYFYFSDSEAANAERFENALKGGVESAIDEIWAEYGEMLYSEMKNLKNEINTSYAE